MTTTTAAVPTFHTSRRSFGAVVAAVLFAALAAGFVGATANAPASTVITNVAA